MDPRRVTLLTLFLAIVAVGLTQAQSSPAAPEDEYRLGPEDVVLIQVWGWPELTGPVTVDFSGKMQLPLVGEIEAIGRRPSELARYLTERYQLLDPSIPDVMVSVSQYRSKGVIVLGQVLSPGRYGFRTIPDIWGALLAAGGAAPDADLAHVQIVRTVEEGGQSYTMDVDLSQGIEDTPKENLPDLQPKDTIIVPAAGGFAVPGDMFQVLGAVRVPGAYRLSTAQRVIEALSVSGGPLPNADLHKVRLTRTTDAGAVSFELDLHGYLYDARPISDLELKPGDTVTVPTKRSAMGTVLNGFVKLAPVITAAVSLGWLISR